MRIRFILSVLLFITVVYLFLSFNSGYSVWSSPNMSFNVTPDTVYINWTYDYSNNITIKTNETVSYWFNVTVDNTTSNGFLFFNYSNTAPSASACGTTYPCVYLLVKNATGTEYTSTSNNITGGNTSILTLIRSTATNPFAGRYRGSIRIYNTSDETENANITVFLDFPVEVGSSTGIGIFNGTLPVNASTYQSFYFNTSSVQNATALAISLTSSQDVDIFIFDNSSVQKLMAKSINKTANAESLMFNFLPSVWGMWEIRVYGNHTSAASYSGNIFFTTLNSTNASNTNQQFSSIDFGVMNISSTAQRNITLKNEGNLTLLTVKETKEIYHVKRFGDSVARNFTFLVPDSSIASRVKAVLNWTGATNYSLNLYKPDGTLVASSSNKYIFANVSGAEHEEYNETTDITAGYWRVEVKNNTVATSPYNVTLFVYLTDSSNWFSSNYSASGFTFNRTGLDNSVYTIQVNLTIPNTSLDGIYEGYLQYIDQNSAGIRIPVRVNITAPVLVINQTINSSTIRIDENINANLIKYLNVTMNNTGKYGLSSIVTTNSTALTYSSYYINFTSIQSPTSLAAGASATINISLNLSTDTTGDQTGVYSGWVFFNTSSSEYPSHPYDFKLNLEVNLTDVLNVSITDIKTADNDNIANVNSSSENVTVQYLKISYVNGTWITGNSIFSMDELRNITSIRLYEANASYWIPNSTGSLVKTSLTVPENPSDSGNYQFNFTIPPKQPGGQYEVRINITTKDGKLHGETLNRILVINDTGLYMNTSSSLSSVNVGSDVYYNVSVRNFGPLAATGATIQFNDNGCAYVTPYADTWSCDKGSGTVTGTSSGTGWASFTFNMNAYNTSECRFRFKIHGDSNGTCSGMYVKGGSTWFNNITGLSITVVNATTTTTTIPSLPPPVEGTPAAPEYLNITSYVSHILVTQNSSNSTTVTVKNINTTRSQDVRLTVEGINSTWFSVSPSLYTNLNPLNSTNFVVIFSIPASAEVKDYSGKFTAISNYVNVSKTFTLRVLPGEETKTEINSTIYSFKQNMTELSRDINQSAARGVNVTLANNTFLQLKALIDQAQSHVNQGDYYSAMLLFSNIKTLFDTARVQLNQAIQEYEAKKLLPSIQLPSGILTYVLIAGGVAAAAILAYLFWPVKTEKEKVKPTVEQLYIPKKERKKEDVIAMLKEKWGKLSRQKK